MANSNYQLQTIVTPLGCSSAYPHQLYLPSKTDEITGGNYAVNRLRTHILDKSMENVPKTLVAYDLQSGSRGHLNITLLPASNYFLLIVCDFISQIKQ